MNTNRPQPKTVREAEKPAGKGIDAKKDRHENWLPRRWEPTFSIDWSQVNNPKST